MKYGPGSSNKSENGRGNVGGFQGSRIILLE